MWEKRKKIGEKGRKGENIWMQGRRKSRLTGRKSTRKRRENANANKGEEEHDI